MFFTNILQPWLVFLSLLFCDQQIRLPKLIHYMLKCLIKQLHYFNWIVYQTRLKPGPRLRHYVFKSPLNSEKTVVAAKADS